MHLNVKSEQRNFKPFDVRMPVNKSVGRSHTQQETATNCGGVGLQAIVPTIGLSASEYNALNHEQNVTGNK